MFKCKLINILFYIFPLKIWQDFLICCHFEHCRSCQQKIASKEEAKTILAGESQIENSDRFWLKIKPRLAKTEKKAKFAFRPWLKWAAATALMAAAVITFVWMYSLKTPAKNASGQNQGKRFQINYLRVENKPARAFIYKPQDSTMIIVWAEKNI